MDEKQKSLKDEIDTASWDMLEPHYERGALFLISAKLELDIVGEAVAKDDVALVNSWLSNQDIQKVEEKLSEDFKKNPQEKCFKFLIIQPYVFLKLID